MKLLEDVTFNKRKMKELEDNLLYKLSATKGTTSLRGRQALAPEEGAHLLAGPLQCLGDHRLEEIAHFPMHKQAGWLPCGR